MNNHPFKPLYGRGGVDGSQQQKIPPQSFAKKQTPSQLQQPQQQSAQSVTAQPQPQPQPQSQPQSLSAEQVKATQKLGNLANYGLANLSLGNKKTLILIIIIILVLLIMAVFIYRQQQQQKSLRRLQRKLRRLM